MRGSFAIAIALWFGGTGLAFAADYSAKNAIIGHRLQDKEATAYVLGIGEGLAWANSYLSVRNQAQLFCAPGNLSITADQYIDILQRYVNRVPRDADDRVGNALLKALRTTFPCS